ncbi:MAG TPA: dynamin family protein, partial [Methylophilus sp.]
MENNKLVRQFDAYARWRQAIVDALVDYQQWLMNRQLGDAEIEQRIQQQLGRLREDKLNVAFVAEFSRGKSELINAIFFSAYGKRLLPSGAGRTTMCPTELRYDLGKPVSLSLLPIETSTHQISISEYKRMPQAWSTIAFDADSRDSMIEAFKEVSRTRRVSVAEAQSLGLYDPDMPDDSLLLGADGMLEIPCWRYAMINFPHPLLKQGLVILDTPGLNAIGAEPELTMHMLPNAHAVLFILGADTGVTRSEMEVWRRYISGDRWKQKGRMAVLNKIDGLWDALKTEDEIEAELTQQLKATADLLGLSREQIFPTSAQKGLLAKVSGDLSLLHKSRLPLLEKTLSDALIPAKQEIVRENMRHALEEIMQQTYDLLASRMQGVLAQVSELRALQGKNEDVIVQMMHKVKQDKASFEQGWQRYQALRNVFAVQSAQLLEVIGLSALKARVRETRDSMVKAAFTKTLRLAMDEFFAELKQRMLQADTRVQEISRMMEAMYARFAEDHGLPHKAPPPFSTGRYLKALAKLEAIYRDQFNTAFTMISHEKMTLTSKFFETVASHMILEYEAANRDTESWLKAVIAPMETQMREHHMQLKRRLESIKRISQAKETLEERIAELNQVELS